MGKMGAALRHEREKYEAHKLSRILSFILWPLKLLPYPGHTLSWACDWWIRENITKF